MQVTTTFDSSLILLTYKGKILLTHKDTVSTMVETALWSLIQAKKVKNESFMESLYKKLEREMNIKLSGIKHLSSWLYKSKKKCFYQAKLSDEDVNNIMRKGVILEFFAVEELKKLSLSSVTRLFMEKHKDLLEQVHN